MKIIVCVKQVPDTTEIKVDPVKGTLMRDGVPSILNPDDANALEAALKIKDEYPNTEVDVVSMGPQQASYVLRECLAMGADRAFLLSSMAFGGADTCSTSTTLAYGVNKIGEYDFIFAGRQAIDGDTAQVGPQLAQRLGLPIATYVQSIREIRENSVIVERQLEDGYEVLEVNRPCLLTAVKEMNEPRYMTIIGIEQAYKQEITVWDENDLDLDQNDCGLKASPTKVFRSFTPPPKGKGEMLSGTVTEMAHSLVAKLTEKHIL
ncbi:MAG: electron transfer flavoprotein subunit beta/FixA family protein [Firmicutes bacterium]|nr:electron transfer flavoprotein subunit beta/FixA family protein [Bacillota bacterium]